MQHITSEQYTARTTENEDREIERLMVNNSRLSETYVQPLFSENMIWHPTWYLWIVVSVVAIDKSFNKKRNCTFIYIYKSL